MHHIEEFAERIRQTLEVRTRVRDQALSHTRTLTRHCSKAIRAVHRNELSLAREFLQQAQALVNGLHNDLAEHMDLYYAGYTQDALKEYAEASIFYSLATNGSLPELDSLDLDHATYLRGLAEAAGELRRRCLDSLRHGEFEEAEVYLGYMDEIYAILITMDYPDAITGGLRRLTDIVRGVTERTRGDLTISLRQDQLERSLRRLEERLPRE